jgi:hypothetical protein
MIPRSAHEPRFVYPPLPMGEFITNVQIAAGGRPRAEVRDAVLASVRRFVESQGFVEAAPGEAPDRSVAIGPAGDEPWIAVYDEATEDQDTRKLDALATTITRDLATSAVSILVHDSDALQVTLFAGGDAVDRRSGKPRKGARKKGDPAVAKGWTELLRPGAEAASLLTALDGGASELGDPLTHIADALGLDIARCGVGYRYLIALEPAGLTRLGFKRIHRPAHETKAEGGPALVPGGWQPAVALSIGEPLRLITSVKNNGGASRGLVIVVWGDALTRGLLAVTKAQVSVGRGDRRRTVEVELAPGASAEESLFVARLPDFELPPGLADQMAVVHAEPGQFQRAMDAFFEADIEATVVGGVLAAGLGTLHIGYAAFADPEAVIAHTMSIEVTPAPRRPLHAKADVSPHELRALQGSRTLFLLAALDGDRGACAEIAAKAMEAWADIVAPDGAGSYDIVAQLDKTAPLKTGKLKAAGLARSKRWRDHRGTLASCVGFSATLRTRSHEDPRGVGFSGFAFSTSSNPHIVGGELVPYLSLWLDTVELPAPRLEAATRLLGGIADEAMKKTSGLQALRGRWGSISFGFSAEGTDYERACGVDGTCTSSRSWAARFLRGVTDDTLWIGAELIERLGDLTALRAVAEVTSLGTVVRARLRDPGKMDDLERALLPLLPRAEDWTAGVTALYKRSAQS